MPAQVQKQDIPVKIHRKLKNRSYSLHGRRLQSWLGRNCIPFRFLIQIQRRHGRKARGFMKQEQADRNWPDDPRIAQVRALDPSSRLMRSLPQRRSVQSLDGIWKVRTLQGQPLDFDFIYEDSQDPGFSRIQVPSSLAACHAVGVDLQEKPDLDWDGQEQVEPGHAPKQRLQAQYLLDFDLDSSLETEEVRLRFEGVQSAFYVWLNGSFIGYSTDSFTASEFDVTGHLQPRNNRLAVLVLSHSSGSWLERSAAQADWGIRGRVCLEGRPSVHIDELNVTTDFNADDDTGEIRVRILDSRASSFGLRLYDPTGLCLFEQESRQRDLRFRVQEPFLWSAEQPDLYRLEIDVYDEREQLTETIVQSAGIRKVWIEDGILLLNGSRMMLHGVNYEPAGRADGAFASREELLQDILCMKRNHINAVRTCGHPLNEAFYTLCDEYGLYVMDEAGIETGIRAAGDQEQKTDPQMLMQMEWRQPLLRRTASMYAQHKNHPSILFWSLGRNSGYGDNLIETSAWLRLHDPDRLIHYENDPSNPLAEQYADCSDLLSRTWSSPSELAGLLEDNPEKPIISGIYMYMEGNSMGGLYRYTQLEQYASYQGGFLERFPRLSADGLVQTKDSPLLQEIRALFSPVRILPDAEGAQILNSMLFEDTSGLRFFYEQTMEGQVIASGELEVDLQPGTYSHFSIPWKQTRAESVCTVLAQSAADAHGVPAGHVSGFGQMVLGKTEYFYSTSDRLEITKGKNRTGFHFGSTDLLFGREGLLSLRHDGTEWLRSIPRPVFAHAFTDLEIQTGFDLASSFWYGATLFGRVRSMRETFDPNGHYATISYQYQLPYPYPSSSSCTLSYTLAAPGILGIDLSLDASRSMPDLAVFGMEFELPKSCSRFIYYGYGPNENYKDRQEGAGLGVFQSSALDNLSMYPEPQECGNHTGVRWLELLDPEGESLRFSKIGRPFEAAVLPCSSETLQSGKTWSSLNLSQSTWVRIASDHKPVGGEEFLNGGPAGTPGLHARNSRRLSFFLSFPSSAPDRTAIDRQIQQESESPDSLESDSVAMEQTEKSDPESAESGEKSSQEWIEFSADHQQTDPKPTILSESPSADGPEQPEQQTHQEKPTAEESESADSPFENPVSALDPVSSVRTEQPESHHETDDQTDSRNA